MAGQAEAVSVMCQQPKRRDRPQVDVGAAPVRCQAILDPALEVGREQQLRRAED